jgi:hypothetical protein
MTGKKPTKPPAEAGAFPEIAMRTLEGSFWAVDEVKDAIRKLGTDPRIFESWRAIRKAGYAHCPGCSEDVRLGDAEEWCTRYFKSALWAYESYVYDADLEWVRLTQTEQQKWIKELREIESALRVHMRSGPIPLDKAQPAGVLINGEYWVGGESFSIKAPVWFSADSLISTIFRRLEGDLQDRQKLKKPRDRHAARKRFIFDMRDSLERWFLESEINVKAVWAITQVLFDDDDLTESLVARTLKQRASQI